jgi:poly(A) polymerase Pap1
MPILTPAYPSMNSSYNVGLPQLRRIRSELDSARNILEQIVVEKGEPTASWSDLLQESDFFRIHANYLQVNIIASNDKDFRTWLGFCESRLRILVASLELPHSGINAYPYAKIFFRGAAAEDGEDESSENDDDGEAKESEPPYIASFFVALRFAYSAERVDLTNCTFEFLQIVNSAPDRTAGMDLTIEHKLWNELPSFVSPLVPTTTHQDNFKATTESDPDTKIPTKKLTYNEVLQKQTHLDTKSYALGTNKNSHSSSNNVQNKKPKGKHRNNNNVRNNNRPSKKENKNGGVTSRRTTSRNRTCSIGAAKVLEPVRSPSFT